MSKFCVKLKLNKEEETLFKYLPGTVVWYHLEKEPSCECLKCLVEVWIPISQRFPKFHHILHSHPINWWELRSASMRQQHNWKTCSISREIDCEEEHAWHKHILIRSQSWARLAGSLINYQLPLPSSALLLFCSTLLTWFIAASSSLWQRKWFTLEENVAFPPPS